jgi:hypothetical protein
MFASDEFRVLTLSVLVANDPTLSAPVDVMSPTFDSARPLKFKGIDTEDVVRVSAVTVPVPMLRLVPVSPPVEFTEPTLERTFPLTLMFASDELSVLTLSVLVANDPTLSAPVDVMSPTFDSARPLKFKGIDSEDVVSASAVMVPVPMLRLVPVSPPVEFTEPTLERVFPLTLMFASDEFRVLTLSVLVANDPTLSAPVDVISPTFDSARPLKFKGIAEEDVVSASAVMVPVPMLRLVPVSAPVEFTEPTLDRVLPLTLMFASDEFRMLTFSAPVDVMSPTFDSARPLKFNGIAEEDVVSASAVMVPVPTLRLVPDSPPVEFTEPTLERTFPLMLMFAPDEFRVLTLSVLVANDPTLSAPVDVMSPTFDSARPLKFNGIATEDVVRASAVMVPVPILRLVPVSPPVEFTEPTLERVFPLTLMFSPDEFRVLTLSVLVANDPTLSAPVDVMSPTFDSARPLKFKGIAEEDVLSVSAVTVPVLTFRLVPVSAPVEFTEPTLDRVLPLTLMFSPDEFSVLVTNDPTLSAPVDVMSPMFDRLRLLKLRGIEDEVVVSVFVVTVPVPTLTAAAKTASIFDRVRLLNEIGLKESVDVMLSTLSVPLV